MDSLNSDHEVESVKAFLTRQASERYLPLILKPKSRSKFTSQLAHFDKFDTRFVIKIQPSDHNPDSIYTILKKKGAPSNCWILSENRQIDAREMPLRDALKATVGYGMGTIVSCLPGRLAYYESEEPGNRFILERL